MAASPQYFVLTLGDEVATLAEFQEKCTSAASEMPEGTVIRQHFQVTPVMVEKMVGLKGDAKHITLLERFDDTGDFFLLRNDVYLTWRMITNSTCEWILKETDNSNPHEKKITYVITKGEDAIMRRLRSLFERLGGKWDPKWTEVEHVAERTIGGFETERFIVGSDANVWLDIAHWDMGTNKGLYAVLTASIVPSTFDYKILANFFGHEQLHYAPSKVIASLVKDNQGEDTVCGEILVKKQYYQNAQDILKTYSTVPDTRFDKIHVYVPFPDCE